MAAHSTTRARTPRRRRTGRRPMSAKAWQEQVSKLLADMNKWAESQNWPVAEAERSITEESVGTYTTHDLNIKTPGAWLIAEVRGRDVIGADGRVDLYVWPALERVMLVREKDKWVVRTEDGVRWPRAWGRNTFLALAKEMSTRA